MTAIKELLAHTCTARAAIDRIAAQAENDPALFAELAAMTEADDSTAAWHAAWALERIARRRPDLFEPMRSSVTRRAMEERRQGVQRLLLSILNRMETPPEPDAGLLDFCLGGIRSPQLSIAARSLCIKLACKLCRTHAPLAHELKLYLEYGDGERLPAAVATARRNALRTIERYTAETETARKRTRIKKHI